MFKQCPRWLVVLAMSLLLGIAAVPVVPGTASATNCNAAPRPGVNLSGCDLHFSDLTGANLRGANLSGADLTTICTGPI